jgi:pimeloyl-ACP methyl ester carboxylesterase
MGGALALLILQKIPDQISALISIEGNLIAEDCGLISRTIATAQENDLLKLKHNLVETGQKSKDRGWKMWGDDVSQVAPQTLQDYAASLVKLSDSGELLQAFALFNGPKAYIYGDGYIGHPLIEKLGSIPSYHVKGADHFAMQNEPDVCARLIKQTIGAGSTNL